MLLSINKLHMKWLDSTSGERFGQWFVNRYIKNDSTDPDLDSLFYEVDSARAYTTIAMWLENNCYAYELPPILRELS